MSTNVYLSEEIRTSTGFQSVPWKNGENFGDNYYYCGIRLLNDNNRLYINIYDLRVSLIPSALEKFVSEISLRDTIPSYPRRDRGIYKLGEAEAEVDIGRSNGEMIYNISVKGINRDEVLDLLYHIKAGTIPPVVSFEFSQVSQREPDNSDNKEEKEKLARLHRLVRRYEVMSMEVQEYCDSELSGWWPFCSKARVYAGLMLITRQVTMSDND